MPVSLLLHADVGQSDPTYSAAFRALCAEAGPDLDERYLLVLVVLVERLRGRQSRWATYIRHLPTDYGAPMLSQRGGGVSDANSSEVLAMNARHMLMSTGCASR